MQMHYSTSPYIIDLQPHLDIPGGVGRGDGPFRESNSNSLSLPRC